ncbi:carbohydrate sulfotransferase 12-like [Solea solea]|uniref:carbohydrate sulfotransferase 12-like n=1 Tax=Solea solea TaxID=90069 RepID=UPI00272A233B|nr:carbohydrate sulfotransferase 12-like [Solea solea]XP_058479713.1 carbohydrate sulfotransferase 12-like [Solea solea]
MDIRRGKLQLLSYGLFLSCFLVMLSIYGWDLSKRLTVKRMDQEQEERKTLLDKMCDGNREEFSDESYQKLGHLIVDDLHGLIYCYVPKVACTNIKKIIYVLLKGEPYGDPRNVTAAVHGNSLPFLKTMPRNEIKAKLKHYTKFLFVRDPFIRLISAYRNKFLSNNQLFYHGPGRYILRRFANYSDPPETAKEALALGLQVSFYNFIQFVLEKGLIQQSMNEHWNQMNRLCSPCLIQYDFIGHQETMQEDIEHLLKILKLQDDIKVPPSYVNVTTKDSVMKWFKTVPLEDRRSLYKIYEKDFQLFGYRKPDELLKG